jgi:hypothetical protein
MSTTSLPLTGSPSLAAMARIEAKRFARHPVFVLAVVLAIGLEVLFWALADGEPSSDLLSMPVLPAFFIGLSSILVAARLVRSTEGAAEAMDTAPGTEARRTLAVAIAGLVPFAAGLAWVAVMLGIIAAWPPYPQDWWFGTAPDVHVWGILLALGSIPCLGGACLGVLTGRWLRFPGAPAVVILLTVAACIGSGALADTRWSELRLFAPWALFHSGTWPDRTQVLYAGNPSVYALYLLCLCAAAVIVAMWHDRTARTPRLKAALAAVVVVGLACLAVAMTTGIQENWRSDPLPEIVGL